MQQLSRAQHIILIYLLWKSYEFEQELWRPRGGGAGGVSLRIHGNEFHSPDFYSSETDIPVLTDAKYPNALLLSGVRSMTGHLTLSDVDANTSGDLIYGGQDVIMRAYLDTIYITTKSHAAPRGMVCAYVNTVSNSPIDYKSADTTKGIRIYPVYSVIQALSTPFALEPIWNNVAAVFNFQSWDGSQRQIGAILGGGEFKIPRAGDITFADPANNKLTWNDTLRLVKEEDYR